MQQVLQTQSGTCSGWSAVVNLLQSTRHGASLNDKQDRVEVVLLISINMYKLQMFPVLHVESEHLTTHGDW